MVAFFNYDANVAVQHILRSSGQRAPTMASPPTITVGGATSALNGNTLGAVTHGFSGGTDNAPISPPAALSVVGTELVRNGSANSVVGARAGNVSYGSARRGNVGRIRFTVDDNFELCLFALSVPVEDAKFAMKIDGEWVSRGMAVALVRANAAKNILVDFGSNAATFGLNNISITSGGSGYAVGDEITLTGGVGTQATLIVQAVSGGAITGLTIKSRGSYSTRPTAPISPGSTTGAGTGATFSLPSSAWSILSTVRRERLVEIFLNRGAVLNGINVAATTTVKPAPATGPRVMFVGDSITESFFVDYPGGQWAAQCAERLGIDDYWLSGLQGTGYVAVNGSNVALIDRLASDVFAYQPQIVITRMGYNDNGASGPVLTAAVQAAYEAEFTALPSAVFIEMNAFRGGNSTPSQSRLDIIRDAFLTTRAGSDFVGGFSIPRTVRSLYIDGPSWETGTGYATNPTGSGSMDHYINSDTIHPSQAGHDREGYRSAVEIKAALTALAAA